MRSISRKITVPLANPSAAVFATASFASTVPRDALTNWVEQLVLREARGETITRTGTRLVTELATRLPLRVLTWRTRLVTNRVTATLAPGVLPQVCCPTYITAIPQPMLE